MLVRTLLPKFFLSDKPLRFAIIALALFSVACAQAPSPAPTPQPAVEVSVFIAGLLNPVGMAPLPGGGLLIAEEGTGEGDDSAGVTLVTADGRAGRLITGLPSSRDSGDLSGVPFVAVSPDGQTLYTAHFNAESLLTLPLDALALPETPYTREDLGEAMQPLNRVKLINPFDITFTAAGVPVVSDASSNGVAIENPDGTTRFFHRFDPLPNPGRGKATIDPVPTGIERVGAEYFVTLTGGCPYPAGGGRLVAIDEDRNQRTVVNGLNMPIDVVRAGDGALWVLEFAQFDPEASCFSGEGYRPNSGRLSRVLAGGTLQPILTDLNFPGSVVTAADGSVYISETFTGRVLKISNLDAVEQPLSMLAVDIDARQALSAAFVPSPSPSPTPTLPPPTTLRFHNVAADVGLKFRHGAFATAISADPAAMMGAGLCWLDYDNDGWLDLYLVNSHAKDEVAYWKKNGGLPANALYKNTGGRFVDVGKKSGTNLALRGNGCVAADFNLDGYTDIFVTADGPNALLWNNGDATFTEGAAAAGLAAPEWNSAASVGDLNGDGWPDLFVAAYIDLNNKIPNPSGAFPQDYYGLPDHFYVNNGDGTFTDVAAAVGLEREERGLGSLLSDLDYDGDLDLYVANDGHSNRTYLSERDDSAAGFHFVDVSLSVQAADSGSGMGVAGGDYDGDGRFDLFVTNWEAELNALYRNEIRENGALQFRYSTFRIGISGLGRGMTGWGTAWADFDHDTDQDLLVANGRVPVSDFETDPELVRFYGNRLAEGRPNQFREWTQRVGLDHEGVGPLLARGSAVADFDNDGDLDVAINTIGHAPALLENRGVTGHWLQIRPAGFVPGVMVRLALPDGRELIREWHVGSSYLASEDPRLHFGLGDSERVDEVWVYWNDGRVTLLENVQANQLLVVEPDAPASQP